MFDWTLLTITFSLPVLILGYQSVVWLRSSAWPPMPVERPLLWLQLNPDALTATGWSGLSRVLEWLFAAPLAAVLFAGGLALHLLSSLLFPRITRD